MADVMTATIIILPVVRREPKRMTRKERRAALLDAEHSYWECTTDGLAYLLNETIEDHRRGQ